jgi:RimJ/RimL family protein N-acetyltransferase
MENDIKLIDIDPERDSINAMNWINSPYGPRTLQLMGLLVPDNYTTTKNNEYKTLKQIINNEEEIAWAIEYKDTIIGIIEVHLSPYESLNAPNISIMIGNYDFRGLGIGSMSTIKVLEHLKNIGYTEVFARVLTHNTTSINMLNKLDFKYDGTPYTSSDGQIWQNLIKEL